MMLDWNLRNVLIALLIGAVVGLLFSWFMALGPIPMLAYWPAKVLVSAFIGFAVAFLPAPEGGAPL